MYKVIKRSVPDELRHLAKIITNAGYKFYIVGGFVRDIFLGSCDAYQNDIDVCGDCPPDTFAQIVKDDKKIKLCEANYPLGTLKLLVGRIDIEYTCFRKESYRGDGHHTPSKIVFTDNIKEDAERRDFTINALYLDPLSFEITDFFAGQKHIKNKVIKTVRESNQVFTEDALRILRMCRFSAKLGFDIDADTLQGAKNCVQLLNKISNERIGVEMDKIVWDTEHLEYGLDAIYNSDIHTIVCPNVKSETAYKTCNAYASRFVRWAVFLSDAAPCDARLFIQNLSLGKLLASEVERILLNRDLHTKSKDEIILYFAKTGQKSSRRQIYFTRVFSPNDANTLKEIYLSMRKKKQFISYNMLNINGRDIMDIFDVSGPKIKKYKDIAYKYAVLNPDKNNINDLKSYLTQLH